MARSRPALRQRPGTRLVIALAILLTSCLTLACRAQAASIRFEPSDARVAILVDESPFATYVYQDGQITRPYFCNVHTPSGLLVTRPHPITSDELDDHPQMHPGLWLAFGDLSGEDYWRLSAPVVHAEFVEPPQADGSRGGFTVRNRYLTRKDQRILCEEFCRFTILAGEMATTILWDSRFVPADRPLVFGDQEEMGLGVRLRRSIAEKTGAGGVLLNSAQQSSAAKVWGQPAAWCDYSGPVDGHPAGVTIAAHPQNLRASWWHARDYGFMAANLFGRRAMRQGAPSQLVVEPGEELRLRYAVRFHDERPGAGYDPEQTLSLFE